MPGNRSVGTIYDTPVTVITDIETGISYIFHLWQDASLESQHEVSDKPTTAGNTGDIVRRLPDIMRLNLMASDDLVVPTIGLPNGVYQSEVNKHDQIENIRALNGKMVQVTTRIGSIRKGVMRYVKSSDVVETDGSASVEVEVREVIEIGETLGTLVVIPSTATDATIPVPVVPVENPAVQEVPPAELPNAPAGAGNDLTIAQGVVGGAIVGAAIGTVVPVVGTAAGAVVGGVLGGFLGGWF